MNKDYIVIIYDKDKKIINQKLCNDLKEVEEFLFNEIKEKLLDFDIYRDISTIDTTDVIDFAKIALERIAKKIGD